MMRFPEQRFTAIVLANRADANPERMARRMADLYLADQLGPPPAEEPEQPAKTSEATIDSERLAEYSGNYFSDELTAIYTMRVSDGSLKVRARKGEISLSPSDQPDVFTCNAGKITFLRSRRKRIVGFTITTGRVRNLRFQKTSKYG